MLARRLAALLFVLVALGAGACSDGTGGNHGTPGGDNGGTGGGDDGGSSTSTLPQLARVMTHAASRMLDCGGTLTTCLFAIDWNTVRSAMGHPFFANAVTR